MKNDPAVLREFVRAPYTETVCYYEWDQRRQAAGAEISGSGIYLRHPEPLDVGTMITLRIQIPGDKAFTVLGRVVRAIKTAFGSLAHAGMGIHFIDIPAEGRAAIARYVEARRELIAA
jgi:hypothetical protein